MKIIECPRDAWQGLHDFVPTSTKIDYINALLKVGYDTIDFGSFVSAKAIPQMRDTHEVIDSIDTSHSKSKLLSIVANERGARDAITHDRINYLGFPLSLSETFQERNTNKSIEEAIITVANIQELCIVANREMVVYLSMGFGNPYGDPYDVDIVGDFVRKLNSLDIKIISLSDTIGVSNHESISYLFESLIPAFTEIEFGAHLHSTPSMALEKIAAAYNAGCKRFDGALRGFGGCPMAEDVLTGNLATEEIIAFLRSKENLEINDDCLVDAMNMALRIFPES